MLQLKSTENVLVGDRPSVIAMRMAYANREVAATFMQIDSEDLALTTGYDLVLRANSVEGNQDASAEVAQDLPDCRMQLKPGISKAAALAAIDAIRGEVDSSWPT